ncbi:MAG: hypothetical protein Q4Q07_10085 [Tissierellia bacterium]|nr:hypothetical protein [Tissierellia bacterium]
MEELKKKLQEALAIVEKMENAKQINGQMTIKEAKEEKALSLEEVRKILADKSRLGFTAEIRELLQKHGAKKLSEIEPSKYKALLDDVEKLQ